MTRYRTRRPAPSAWIEDDLYDDYPQSHVPMVDEFEATPTGLLDQNGDEIWRLPNPIGFIWND